MTTAAELVAITHEPTVATMFATALVTRLFWLAIVCPTVLMGHGRVAAATVAAQHSTAQHSTAQHSTAQHSTAQHSTAQLQTVTGYIIAHWWTTP